MNFRKTKQFLKEKWIAAMLENRFADGEMYYKRLIALDHGATPD